MSVADAKKMRVSSDYPMDKVVFLKTGSYSFTNGNGLIIPIPHGLKFTPLVNGSWSMTSNFSIQYEFSSGEFPSGNNGYLYKRVMNIFADATNIYITGDNIGSTVTAYYRIYGFEPSHVTSSYAPLSAQADDFSISSDYNNPKLLLNNYIDLPAGTATDQYINVLHNIGTIPQAMGWVHYNTWNGSAMVDAVHPVGTTISYSESITLVVNEVEIVWVVPAYANAHRAHYRVYIDQ